MNKPQDFTIDLDKLLEASVEMQIAIISHRMNLDMARGGLLKNPNFAAEMAHNKLVNCIKNLKNLLEYEE